ncbi:MAG: cellulase [Armatimonadetes bacterium]|nr:cellulase [Armatimonadota bacterium]
MRSTLLSSLALSSLMLVGCSAAAIDTVTVDVNAERHAISPLIYGVNFPSAGQHALLNLKIARSGGNATTRYDWQTDATSSGSDWYFLTHTGDGTTPSFGPDKFVTDNKTAGAESMLTVPIIGWVAKLGANNAWTWSFSVAKYGAQLQSEPGRPDAGNGIKPNGTKVTGNDPTDANKSVAISYQQGWIQHLIGKFGKASAGGVKYYLLDNEPCLWQETHRDVQPTGAHMDDMWLKSRNAAFMIKSVDSSALVCGPEEWGWLGYKYSGYDFQWLGANGWNNTPPDRSSHNNMDFAPWMLQQFKNYNTQTGTRLLDVFTLHYYPQGNYGDSDTSQAAQLWRNRSTRSLWDRNYIDESWINDKIYVLPRMKDWVAQYYPGTKIGITEYNFGAESHISGAIAQADTLGIFGRENVDLATRWVAPATSSVTFKAMQMYRNVDGQKTGFGDTSVKTTVANPDDLSAFGSVDSAGGAVRVMVIHKRLSGNATVDVNLAGLKKVNGKATVYQLTSGNQITKLADVQPSGSKITLTVPPQSITLIIQKAVYPVVSTPTKVVKS